MDQHFAAAGRSQNLPFILGLVGFWHRVVCGYPARAVIPYDQRLSRLPAYLQQLDMESNGKGVTIDGAAVVDADRAAGLGRARHQWPARLLPAAAPGHRRHSRSSSSPRPTATSRELQPSSRPAARQLPGAVGGADARAARCEEARAQLPAKGMKPDEVERIAPHRVFSGNRPSITILYKKLDPFTFGRLIALYEHRVFVEAQLFGINAFDQWGVELGKELATGLLPVVEGKQDAAESGASTAGLVRQIHAWRAG